MAIESLGIAMRHVSQLFGGGTATGLSDGQLLDRFLADRDASAFEALVTRHGPMVLSVCRGVLRDQADAEDAYQATFLILVKKARTIRAGQSLGGWLYQVAHRVAIQANAVAARRRAREREAGQMTVASATSGTGTPDDLLPALHDEIARLPEKYRLPVVLCDLEGLPQAEAAGQLNWSERTLRRRLAQARDRLKARLARRGLAPEGTTLSAVFLGQARAAVPPAWNAALVRAAIHSIDPVAATATATAAAQSLTQEVLEAMFVQKLTIAAAAFLGAGMLAWAAAAALVPRGDEPGREMTKASPAPRPAAAPRAEARSDSPDIAGTFPVRGRVLDPDGRPVAGAEIFVRHNALYGWSAGEPVKGQKGRVATTDADGRFRFDLDKGSSDLPWGDDPAWHGAQIAAVAPGFGLAWVEARALLKGDEVVLRLVRDDTPIRGRVVDPQGRPIAGVTVRLQQVARFKDGADLDAILASGEAGEAATGWWHAASDGANGPGGRITWTTDADGRFEIRGIGRDRIATLAFSGPKLASSSLQAMTRPAKAPPKPRPKPSRTDRDMMFMGRPPGTPLVGATFEHVAGPSKPIVGIVRSKVDGRPVGGVKVFGMEGATWTGTSTRTDAQGRFRLDGLPKGEVYRVSVNEGYRRVAPYLTAQVDVTDTEGLKPIETTFDLPKGVEITGRLIDPATGKPVPHGQITYVTLPTNPNPGGSIEDPPSPTDPTFRLSVPPGGGMLMVEARGNDLPYLRARLRKADKGKGVGGIGDGEPTMVLMNAHHAYKIIDVPADAKSVNVDLELTRGFTRKGRVVDPDGHAVAGVRCYGLAANWGEMKTLADGTFEVLGLEPDHPRQLIFAHRGRRLVGSAIIKGEDSASEAPLVVTLDRPAAIAGRLVDEDGLPIAGASLGTLTFNIDGDNLPPGPGEDSMWPDSDTVTTGADGRFRIDGLKPGVKTSHGVSFPDRPGYWGDTGKALRDIVVSKAGEVRDLGDIQVKAVRQ